MPKAYIAMSGGAVLMILVFLPDLLAKKPKKEETQEETK